MITPEMRSEIAFAVTGFVESIREIMEPGATSERQIELVREAVAMALAGTMNAAEGILKLGPRTEAQRIVDRAHELFEIQAAFMRQRSVR